MRLVFSMLCLLSLLFMAVTCNGDDAFWPAYRQELVEVLTDEIGQTAYLVRDDADTLAVSNGMAWGNLTPDTAIRALVLYEIGASGKTIVHGVSSVLSSPPREFDQAMIRMDPVYVDAITHSGRYLNFFLKIKTSGTGHFWGFIDRGVIEVNDGVKLLRLSLYHDRHGDGTDYKRQICLSCPLYGYGSHLVSGRDSVEVQVNTYDGVSVRRFVF